MGDRVGAAVLQTSAAQILYDPACQGFDAASRVLLDRSDNDARDFGLLSRIGRWLRCPIWCSRRLDRCGIEFRVDAFQAAKTRRHHGAVANNHMS